MAAPTAITEQVDDMFERPGEFGTTYAVVVLRAGEIVAERYGGALPHLDRPDESVGPETPLLSWSVAKSVLHAAVGVLAGEGRLDPDVPVGAPEWAAVGDPRAAITIEHLLTMRDGLAFTEDYVDAGSSDVIEMLFGSGRADTAHFAADRPLAHAPGTVFNYASGASNIVARAVGDVVGRGAETEAWLREAIFDPLGMTSARIRLDDAGTFIASSFVYATARDWVRFGECYLRDGRAGGRQIVPADWAAHGWRIRSRDPETGTPYGAHWWGLPGPGPEAGYAGGYAGQRVLVCPAADLVVARFGNSEADQYPAIARWCRRVIEAVGSAATFRP
ncbi:MAG: serine hydrolase domain-containing protein [Actinomycetota bacterium]